MRRSTLPFMKVLRANPDAAVPSVRQSPPQEVFQNRGLCDLNPSVLDSQPWWMWPHLWSLDAPLVAVMWQRWWARNVGVSLGWPQETVLALSVWMVYLADRLLDSGGGSSVDDAAARRGFYRRRRVVVRPLALGLATFLVIVTPRWLSAREFIAGLGLLGLAGAYFALVHHPRKGNWTAALPKEAAVGFLFALGSYLFTGCAGGGNAWIGASVAVFAFVCFLNCALITSWENSVSDQRDPTSLSNAFPGLIQHLGAGCWLLAATSLVGWWTSGNVVFLPLACSSALLGLLNRFRAGLSVNALRVMADVVLLTPCGLLPLVR